jgi:hypothetical protein
MMFRIIEDSSLVDMVTVPNSRSPARAERRRKRGFPQCVKIVARPKQEIFMFEDKLIMHPSIVSQFKEACQRKAGEEAKQRRDELAAAVYKGSVVNIFGP